MKIFSITLSLFWCVLKWNMYCGWLQHEIFLYAGFHFIYIGTYLLVITSREKVGTFLGFPIFRITAMKFLPCNDASRFATAQEVRFCKVQPILGIYDQVKLSYSLFTTWKWWLVQKKDETYFRTLLQALEATPGLYFSYETDLTLK